MLSRVWSRSLIVALVALGGWAAVARPGRAVEPTQPFLEGLRERRMFDEAIDYLESLRTSTLVSDEFKQRITYEQGTTLVQAASAITDFAIKDKQLDAARLKLDSFCQASPGHDLVASAKSQLANILAERARVKVARARQSKTAADPKALLNEARQLFVEAQKAFAAAEQGLDAQLKKFPTYIGSDDPQMAERRQQVAGDLAECRINQAQIEYEIAKTLEPDAAAAKKHFTAAATQFAKIFDTYRTRQAGLYAHLWEGRCQQALGDTEQALTCYKDLMDMELKPDQARMLRSIRNQSFRQALECWSNGPKRKLPAVIERGEQWARETTGGDDDSDALAIRYFLAVAYESQLKDLSAKDPNRRKMAANAKQQVILVAKKPGEFQKPAKVLRDKLGGGKENEEPQGPATFTEALETGRAAMDQVQATTIGIKMAAENKDEETAATMAKEKKEATETAFRSFRRALTLLDKVPAKDQPDIKDVNAVRYYLCYLYWDGGEFYESAVMGDYLARHYPDSLEGRQGAKIALASFAKLYGESKDADKDFEIAGVTGTADYIIKQWPKEQEAEDAALMLLNFAIQQRQLDKALQLLKQIPETSSKRGQAELRAGQAFWSTYLKSAQAPPDERPSQKELDSFKLQAETVLRGGIERLKAAGEPDPTIVGAMLSLAQIYLDTSQADKAIETIEDPKFGPLTLVKAKDPTTQREGFAAETYKVALRAYVAAEQMKKAEGSMNALEKLVGKSNDTKANEALTQIYIALGHELQQQLERLRTSGQKAELEKLSKAFNKFLERILDRKEGNNFNSLIWVAETFYGLASGLDDGRETVPAQAGKYYSNAAKAYDRILASSGTDPAFVPSADSLVGIRLRSALCQRRLGKFDEAIQLISDVLRERPMMLTAQIEGAETYQAQGLSQPKAYEQAMRGGSPNKDRQNIIWGWGKLAKMTMGNPKFEEIFFQARRKLAESRYMFGVQEKNKESRNRIAEAARQDLWYTYKLHPQLGGAESYAEYDRLLKRIQKTLEEKPLGLEEFKNRDAAAESRAEK